MKLLDQIKEIFNKYELKLTELPTDHKNVYSFLRECPEFKKNFHNDKTDWYFIEKYRSHIPKGWYGFSLGDPIIPIWCEIIDEIVQLCIDNDPNFEIHQIKIKFGGICFYVESNIIEDTFEIECLIENTLYDKALIY